MKTSMPALFIGHGSPMNTLEDNRYTRTWREIGRKFGQSVPRPRAVLAISAHWYINATAITAMARPKTIHDFGGFPQALFDYQYPAPGDPELAARVQSLLAPLNVASDQGWGLDHGTWSVLGHLFPDADIPVVQLSIDAMQPNKFHYEVGKKFAVLRDEGVLILGSGNLIHNLRLVRWGDDSQPYPWATRIEQRLKQCISRNDHAALINYLSLDPEAHLAIPTPEHYLPLLYVLGTRRPEDEVRFPLEGIDLGSLSMLSLSIGN
jgi:4,5-DOPA dioxygenase extradiol